LTDLDLTRGAYGVEVRPTMIHERTLELAHKLCWNSEDLGISRVHIVDGQSFRSRSALEKHCRAHGLNPSDARYFFDWLPPVKQHSGVARQTYLVEEHWCNREQVINILVDTAMQAYLDETRLMLSRITGADFNNAQLVKFRIVNRARQYTGDPDTVFIDPISKNIALIEIKIGTSSTKYSIDQNVKYLTLAQLLKCETFFPGYTVHMALFGPHASFAMNTHHPHLLGPTSDSQGVISFTHSAEALSDLRPTKIAEIRSLLAARLKLISGGAIAKKIEAESSIETLLFYAWPEIARRCPAGLLVKNLQALMKYLSPPLKSLKC